MNESQFAISIDYSVSFLKKIELFKRKGVKQIGKYSEETKKISKTNNFREIYNCIINNNDYDILLADDSIFQFSLKMDGNSAREYDIRYNFIQNPAKFKTKKEYISCILNLDETDKSEDIDNLLYLVDENEYEQFLNEQNLNSTANIIRYDSSPIGYQPMIHSYSHLHIGMNQNFRIPVSILLNPFAFVKFCIKNTYYEKWKEAFGIFDNFYNDILNSKETCSSLDERQWSKKEEAELYIK